jgi:hypothetical protein
MLRTKFFAAMAAIALLGVMAISAMADSPHMAPHHHYRNAAHHGSTRSTSPAIRLKGAPNHAGASDTRPDGHIGANRAVDFGGHESSGWYQRGFGGTRDPGWGYNFGPHLGGFGR